MPSSRSCPKIRSINKLEAMKNRPNKDLGIPHSGGKHIAWRIALAELQSLFFSPIAWIILIVFTVQLALSFTGELAGFVQWQENTSQGYPNLTARILGSGIFGMTGIAGGVLDNLYLFIPLLTMGLLSKEFHGGSIKLLYSSPVRNHRIIFGKFFSMMVYGLVLMLVVFVFILWAGLTVKDFGWSHAFTAMLGAYLLICTYAAIGLFMSSLTAYQVVAAIATLAIFMGLNMLKWWGQGIDFVREITYWFALDGRAESFINGMLCTEDFLYFILITLLFLSLSVIRLNSVRQKSGWRESLPRYTGVILLTVTLGYLSSRPMLMAYHDATETKQNTLVPNSQQIVKSMKGGLTITSFVNLLDDVSSNGMPNNRKYDISQFNQFIRFKPEIKMKYVFYYADNGSLRLKARYPGLTAKEMLEKICIVDDIDPRKFMSVEEVQAKYNVNLEEEYFRMVRLVERESGEKTWLRMYDDPMPHPKEAEVAAAFKSLTMKLPTAGFLQGHRERSFEREGDRSYRRISTDKLYRHSLINNGFAFELVYLDDEIPAEIDLLVIAEMRDPLTAGEQARLDRYIARGGNLFVLGDIRRQEIMNPVIEQFGARFMPGQLVRVADDGFAPDFIISRATDKAVEMSNALDPYGHRNGVSMPGCVALEYTANRGYAVTEFYRTQLNGVWNELQTTDFIDDVPRLNPETGESEGSRVTLLALTREVNGKEQRILISGDADCIGNGEITIFRSGMPIWNPYMPPGVFYWLSGNEVPIDVRRPLHPDNYINMGLAGLGVAKAVLIWVFPALMLAACLVLWLRRRGR